jgi:Xaa-Pro aminopeptidase
MRHDPIDSSLFDHNRQRLRALLPPRSVAVVHANDLLPTNADATAPFTPNSDLFYLTGIEQEETILLIAPDAADERHRETLFIREANETTRVWEGAKLDPDSAAAISGVATVKSLPEFHAQFRARMLEADHVFLNSNEHARATPSVRTRDLRFIDECRRDYPLHHYARLAPLLAQLRATKAPAEIKLIRRAIEITARGFHRVARALRPGVAECELEAELAHEFTRSRARFAYSPIVASGPNACTLHYTENTRTAAEGELLLLDAAAAYANYNADLTRVLPVSGRFTPRQRALYEAVLRVLRASIAGATVGKRYRDWLREAQEAMDQELLLLGLLTESEIRDAPPGTPACRRFFMHGIGHPLGLDVHDVSPNDAPFEPGTVLTVEPGLYLPAEATGIRLENNVVVTDDGPVDLMEAIPLEPDAIEDLMAGGA